MRDFVSTLLTRCKGEYVFRIGARPLRDMLFSGELSEAGEDVWLGNSISEEQLDLSRTVLTQAVEDVGGNVSEFLHGMTAALAMLHFYRYHCCLKRGRYILAQLFC